VNFSLLFKPLKLIDRLAVEINRRKRKSKLKGTPADGLALGYIDSLELLELIRNNNFKAKVIFDVGANIGTWTLLAKSFFGDAEVHAFEPLTNHANEFKTNTQKLTQTTLHQICLGNENTTTVINISSFSDASSLLNPTALVYEEYGVKTINEEQVTVKRADELIGQNILPVPGIIKLDVQGFELEVLKGFGKYLKDVTYIIAEVSFKEYYQGQALFPDIVNYLAAQGLNIYAFGHGTPTGQELTQIDILFKKKD
jgi:FkbM family methyltransferase